MIHWFPCCFLVTPLDVAIRFTVGGDVRTTISMLRAAGLRLVISMRTSAKTRRSLATRTCESALTELSGLAASQAVNCRLRRVGYPNTFVAACVRGQMSRFGCVGSC